MNEQLYFTVTDPWEFKDENGFLSFEVDLVERQEGTFLVRARRSVFIEGAPFQMFLVSPRHAGNSFDRLAKAGAVQCNATGIPPDRANTDDPFDLRWWRGGGAMIGTLSTTAPIPSRSDDSNDS